MATVIELQTNPEAMTATEARAEAVSTSKPTQDDRLIRRLFNHTDDLSARLLLAEREKTELTTQLASARREASAAKAMLGEQRELTAMLAQDLTTAQDAYMVEVIARGVLEDELDVAHEEQRQLEGALSSAEAKAAKLDQMLVEQRELTAAVAEDLANAQEAVYGEQQRREEATAYATLPWWRLTQRRELRQRIEARASNK